MADCRFSKGRSRPRSGNLRSAICNLQSAICNLQLAEGEVLMDVKTDDGLKTLLEQGKAKGYLTYDQVNEYLPDEAVNPEKLDQLLVVLEEHDIQLIDETEA